MTTGSGIGSSRTVGLTLLTLLVLSTLAGCGAGLSGGTAPGAPSTGQSGQSGQAGASALVARAAAILRPAPVAPPFRLSAAALETVPGPVLAITMPGADGTIAAGPQAGLVVAARNGGAITWRSPDGATISTRDGILVASRAFGYDTMVADTAPAAAALSQARRSGSATAVRRASYYLGAGNALEVARLICGYVAAPTTETIAHPSRRIAARRITERCVPVANTDAFDVENRYWYTPGGTLVRAEQLLHPAFGHIRMDWVK